MAAHDDKISDNRRKLFKALSAAPVVMTLRPGAALATASAYQCLANKDADVFIAAPANECTDEIDCFAYELLTYWNVQCGSDEIIIVVEVNSAFYRLDIPGVQVSTVSKDGDNKLSGNLGACYFVELSSNDGYFLVLVEPVNADGTGVLGDSGEAVDINPVGVYPATLPAPTYQGITHTCLCSIHPDATGTFVKG